MGVGHRQEPDRRVVEEKAALVSKDLRCNPEAPRLTRQAQLELETIGAAIGKNGRGVEREAVLTQARHEYGQDLLVGNELGVKRHRDQSLVSSAKKHGLEAKWTGNGGQKTYERRGFDGEETPVIPETEWRFIHRRASAKA